MSARELKTHILPGLLSGARGNLPVERAGVATPLQALALAAQALRFERPLAPVAFQVEDTIADHRAIVPEAVRRSLIRLLTLKTQARPNVLPDAVARALDARGLRLHPFDLAKLEGFVTAHAEQLGAEASAFAERQAPPEQRRSYFEADALNDATWTQATPARREAYLAGRRRQDAAAARALVEAVWASEPAEIRARLLAVLAKGLGPEDAAFLEGLAKDRAPRVRELAARLLARLPGHEGDNPALMAVTARIKSKQTGILVKRRALSLELPATVTTTAAITGWIGETFSPVGLDELAVDLGLKTEDLPGAAEKDDNLLLGLAVMATRDQRFDILSVIAGRLPDAWDQLYSAGVRDLDGFTAEARRDWVASVVRPETWMSVATLWSLTRLPDLLDGPAPEALMRRLLDAPPWRALLKDEAKLQQDFVHAQAALCPPSLRPALRGQLAPLEAALANPALLFLDIMDALESPHA